MRISTTPILLSVLLAVFPACIGTDGPGSGSSGSGASSGGNIGPGFDGITLADALSTSTVSLSWPQAVGASPAASANVKYHIYRGSTAAEAQLDSSFIASTSPGITTFVDTGLEGFEFSTLFYRVTAEDAEGALTDSMKVASARLPSPYSAGSQLYSPTIEDLWQTAEPNGSSQTCATCHTSGNSLDMSSYQSLLASASFIVPYDGETTWNEFVLGFVDNPISHFGYWSDPSLVLAIKDPLSSWINEGALEFGDNTPPVFQFDNIENAGKYFGETGPFFGEMTVSWFNASDPESLPLSGDPTGQLEYHVYAGLTSDTIDWLNPINLQGEGTNPYYKELFSTGADLMSYTFAWPDNRCVAIIRALDASGRAETFVDPANPTTEELKLRWRNMSINEKEIVIDR
ncbi:MAG: hypothetical protein QGH51_04385 [Planctomycetota bacterium]|jgi:hypothetical protein|nr:hypothetical protein [Planctomycetota bacterium]MDP6941248.1 hypothetical protein [Planctomycetota bacterium]